MKAFAPSSDKVISLVLKEGEEVESFFQLSILACCVNASRMTLLVINVREL
jgi:hypothetical protein